MKSSVDSVFDRNNFQHLCDQLANRDEDLQSILVAHGYPPMWTRENSFETLVHIILEQQVSLASALAALHKLKEKTTTLTPNNILQCTDEEMRACFVSRQKNGYIKGLARAIESGTINLAELARLPNDAVREKLLLCKGIGNWTVDVYLMFVLQRADIFPLGDLAAVNALKKVKRLPAATTRDELLAITAQWQPFRTIACMMLWHYYLSNTKRKITPVD